MEVASKCDVVYQTRIQRERFGDRLDLYEAACGKYIVDEALLGVMQKNVVIMHPLPRLNEVSLYLTSSSWHKSSLCVILYMRRSLRMWTLIQELLSSDKRRTVCSLEWLFWSYCLSVGDGWSRVKSFNKLNLKTYLMFCLCVEQKRCDLDVTQKNINGQSSCFVGLWDYINQFIWGRVFLLNFMNKIDSTIYGQKQTLLCLNAPPKGEDKRVLVQFHCILLNYYVNTPPFTVRN